ncbi:hypothetical protein [Ferdinandcohnia sp. SAFN-114]|uniref:hypothetical protein n=1 Tax=Ferdinandcohnia sp. SAFN-114 TaxID=3387275 RepID=UPI003F812CD5
MSWSIKKKRRRKTIYFLISLFFLLLFIIFQTIHFSKSYSPGNLTINAPFGLGTYEFNRAELTQKELDISWKLYVQLTTRKAAIPVDQDHDIITEIYDSWYELFKSTREYLLELSTKDLEGNDNAQKIVKLSLDVLNQGLRPHLTEWQGKYRKWYETALVNPEYKDLSPQEIQRKYKDYDQLMISIQEVNENLILYAEELKKFSYEEPPNIPTKIITKLKEKIEELDYPQEEEISKK